MNSDIANVYLSETASYGFMIANGIAVVALALFLWRKGLFKGLNHVELDCLLPEEEKRIKGEKNG